ncbi:MAG TPA: hypothetical protein VF316_06735 [Polyangiaceae bacterium]
MNLATPARVRKRLATDKGTIEIYFLSPEVVLQRATGQADLAHAQAIATTLQAAIDGGARIAIFDDFSALEGYTSEARIELTTWTRASLPKIASIHILVKSKIVSMGVAVANIALRNVNSYTDRAPFDAAIMRALDTPVSRHV